ncbi:MAG: hypothetical protein MdMp014T_0357 [Treponematales bacterium]
MKESNKFLRALGTGLALALTGVLLLAGCDDKDDEPSVPSVTVPGVGDLPAIPSGGTAAAASEVESLVATYITGVSSSNSPFVSSAYSSSSGTYSYGGVMSIAEYLLDEAESDAEDEAEGYSYSDNFEVTNSAFKVKATGHVEASYSRSQTSYSGSSKSEAEVKWTDNYSSTSPVYEVLKDSVVRISKEETSSASRSGTTVNASVSQKGAIAYGVTIKLGGKWIKAIVDGTYSVSGSGSYTIEDEESRVPALSVLGSGILKDTVEGEEDDITYTITVSGTAKFYGDDDTKPYTVAIDSTNYGKFVGDNDN